MEKKTKRLHVCAACVKKGTVDVKEIITAKERDTLLTALRAARASRNLLELTGEEVRDLEQALENDQILLMLLPKEELFQVSVCFTVQAGSLEVARQVVNSGLDVAMAHYDRIIRTSVTTSQDKEGQAV